MRIAYLTAIYPRATDAFIQREVAELRNRGVEIHTFSLRRAGDEHLVGLEQKAERENTFYLVPPNPISLILAHLSLFFRSPSRYWQALKLAWFTRQVGLGGTLYQLIYFAEAGILARQIQLRNIQHLHDHLALASCTVAMLAAELGGFTFSFTMHGPYIFFEPYRWRLDKKIEKALFVACISYYCRSQGMVFSSPEQWGKLHVIHCGVEPSLFSLVSHQELDERLLYIGRLSATKGLPILLESLVTLKASRPGVQLTVVGDGEDRTAIEGMAVTLGLQENVKFMGYQSQAEVRQHLQQAGILVLPSFAEGIPVVLMEAMAAGLPVVATQIAGVSELVEDGISGYLVPPGESDLLAECLEKLLGDSQLRERLGKAGRTKVERDFNLSQEVARLHRLFSAALAGKREGIRPALKAV